jgi:RHS repeat-associated protein
MDVVRIVHKNDGDGKRVQKSSGKLYWYGVGSDPLDETDLAGNTNNASFSEYVFFGGQRIARRDFSNNVFYYFADHLGTARIVANSSGTPVDDSDFYPFGGERVYLNSSPQNYKFTGKERDSESGLDDFGLRYFGSSMGRFMSPDSIANDWELLNPQTWNRYAYARNNPLAYVDPDGAAVELIGQTDEERKKALAALQATLGNKQASDSLYINEVKDGDNTRYFVGIKGDVGDFENLSSGAKDLGELVGAKQVVEFGLTDKDLPGAGKGQGSFTYAPGEIGNANPRVLVNPSAVASASIFFSDTVFGSSRFGPGTVRDTTTGIAAFHEFGHAWKMWQNINAARNGVIPGANGIDPRLDTSREALRWENRMRQQVYGPVGPKNAERKVHD